MSGTEAQATELLEAGRVLGLLEDVAFQGHRQGQTVDGQQVELFCQTEKTLQDLKQREDEWGGGPVDYLRLFSGSGEAQHVPQLASSIMERRLHNYPAAVGQEEGHNVRVHLGDRIYLLEVPTLSVDLKYSTKGLFNVVPSAKTCCILTSAPLSNRVRTMAR